MSLPTPEEEEIFFEALEQPDAAAREELLDRACGADEGLRARILVMLSEHERAGALLREVATGYTLTAGLLGADIDAGAVVGPYRLVKRIGEGGGGLVFEAQQEHPVRRRVALKVLKSGMDTRRVIARFEAERQTLALMEHPNVARVIDAGATAVGRPFFVMELVAGEKITAHCERHALPLPARIALVRSVCDAVQHAHQKGIIHRDLKPSNILVALIDGRPVPKVIDFGIAKAVATPAGENADFTLADQPVGTPAYMSPEQISGRLGETDTRSDIYSLGVILYELVAGRPPFDNEELVRGGLDEMRRRILLEEPPAPSRLRSAESDEGAKNELDWIVLKAMAKDRERRYPTVRALADDLDRLLAGAAVEAHPPGRWYRLQKLVLRNRLAAASILVASLALTGGFTASTILYLRAKSAERQQARLRAEAEEREHIAKAAILLMQGKPGEAHAEIERTGGRLTQPSIEATNVFRSLALWSAMQDDWDPAARRLLALSRVSRFDDTDMTDNATRNLLPAGPVLLEAGHVEQYRDFTQLLLERLGGTKNPVAAEHVLKICLQHDPSPQLLSALSPAALVCGQSVSSGEDGAAADRMEAWRCAVLGLWHLRRGEPGRAESWCDRSLALRDDERAREAYAQVVRGMARRKLGQADQAANDFETTGKLIAGFYAQPRQASRDGMWYDWLASRQLLREATAAPDGGR